MRIALGFAVKLEGQVRERPSSESQRTREVSWRIIATNTGVAPAPAPNATARCLGRSRRLKLLMYLAVAETPR
jgi:hypothetical protein